MTSILTNSSATIALQTLRSISTQLDTTSNRVSTGQRISSAADGAAYWAIASTLKSDNGSLSALKDAMSLDKNSIDAASAGLNKVIDQLSAIKNALTSATSEQADKAKLQNDIKVALDAIKNYSDNTVMNGSNWLTVKSDDAAFNASKNLVAAYSRVGNTVSVSKTTLDTSSFALYDNKAAGATGGRAANTDALAAIASSATMASSAGYTVGVKPNGGGVTYQEGFMDTTYVVGSPSNAFTTSGASQNSKLTTTTAINNATTLSGLSNTNSLLTDITTSDTLIVNGQTITFVASGASGNQLNTTDTLSTMLAKIDTITGASVGTSSVSAGVINIGTGLTQDLSLGGTALAKLGLSAGTTNRGSLGSDVSIATMDITAAGVDSKKITSFLKIVDATTQQLLTGASKLGSMSTLLKTQQEFTQQLMDINNSSIGSLVDANIEEESTKLKALQTQQQLGIQSLSIANSSSQNVLSLFR